MAKKKKKKVDLAYSDLRVYKDKARPTVFKDKRKRRKHKKPFSEEEF